MKETASLSHEPLLVWGSSTTSQCVPEGSHTMFDNGISEKFTQLQQHTQTSTNRESGTETKGRAGMMMH